LAIECEFYSSLLLIAINGSLSYYIVKMTPTLVYGMLLEEW